MADFLKEAIEMVKAQATLKEMTPEQTMELVAKYQQSFLTLANTSNEALLAGQVGTGEAAPVAVTECGEQVVFEVDPQEALKRGQPNLITCAICGYQGKVLAKHIKVAHGMDVKEYKNLCGYTSKDRLTARNTTKARQKRMQDNPIYKQTARYKEKEAGAKKDGAKGGAAKK